METYQVIACCLVSLLLIRRDFSFIIMVLYVLYYVCTDLLLQYDIVFYHQQYLILLDVVIFNITLYTLLENKRMVQHNDIRLLVTVGTTILSVHFLSLIDNTTILTLLLYYNFLNYFLSNWHLELLVLLLINVKVSELPLSQKDFMNTIKTVLGVTVILTVTILNYL